MSVPKRWHVGRESNQAFIDAVREFLGLAPMFRGPQSEVERFHQPERPWRPDGMTARVFDGNNQ